MAAGDFEPRRLKALLTAHLGTWAPRQADRPAIPQIQPAARPRVRRVRSAGEQVHLLIGHLGIRRHDPDYDALCVMDHILGSGPGFTDRLSRVLRDELGLAYTVGGGITDSADVEPGIFRVYLGTAPDEADRAIEAVMEQILAMHRGAFSDEEVDRARRYLAGAWVYDFQTTAQRAERLVELERWGLPLEEPRNWPDRILQVSARDVRRAARKHLHPEALARVEYGPIRPRNRKGKAHRDCA